MSFTQEGKVLNQLLKPVEPHLLASIFHRSIGAFKFQNQNFQDVAGSGMLISKNIVLTAAHNLFNKE
jgi:hypothetical protein